MEQPERIRIADWAYERLQGAIFAEEFSPGTRLSVPALADYLGIGRSPVREAIQRLVQNGLAEEQAHRGAVVARITASRLAQYYEVRAVLEGLAARLATSQLTKSDLASLTQVLEEHKQHVAAGRRQQFLASDASFHLIIRESAGNSALVHHLNQLQDLIRLGMTSTSVVSGPQEAIRDHERILTELRARRPDSAEEAAKQHVFRLRDVLLEHASQQEPMIRQPETQ